MDVLGLTISLVLLYICMGRGISNIISDLEGPSLTGIEVLLLYTIWPVLLLIAAGSPRD